MELADAFTNERRARLAAERLLEVKQNELAVANRRLSAHALDLASQVIEKREENAKVRTDLELVSQKHALAERRLWDSVEAIPDGFAVFGADDRLVAANRSWLKSFDGLEEITPGVSYRRCLELAVFEGLIDLQGERAQGFVARLLQRWEQPRPEPLVVRLWSGAFVRLIDSRTPEGDVVSLAMNITSDIRREGRLRDARTRAEAASRAKSAFLAKMSHELRTPMNGVIGMAELLTETTLDGEQAQLVETIRHSAQSLLVLINDVLDFSKAEAARLVLATDAFDLFDLLRETLAVISPLTQKKGLGLYLDFDIDLPTAFVGDPLRLRQILLNLLGNAVKFTETGHVVLRLSGLPDDQGGWRLSVVVEDTGIGIARAHLDHIFGEFNQAEDEKSRRYEGSGLGLAICRQLVNLMDGEVWVDSEVGVGSKFGFDLRLPLQDGAEVAPVPDPLRPPRVLVELADPVQQAILERQVQRLGCVTRDFARPDVIFADTGAQREDGVPLVLVGGVSANLPEGARHLALPARRSDLAALLASLNLGEQPPNPAPEPELRLMRVLCVDDNSTNRKVFELMVKKLTIDLRLTDGGAEAVRLHQDFAPDVIFMDISMPGMDGKEATRLIRIAEAHQSQDGQRRHVPIVAVTAHAMDGDEAEILAAGLDRYLTKPLKKDAIIAALIESRPADCLDPMTPRPEAPAPAPDVRQDEKSASDLAGNPPPPLPATSAPPPPA